MEGKPSIIVILGATSTGKSEVAVRVAKQLNGEIVSADSRQVYRGLDIGSGKITKTEMKNVPHHLLDVASPRRRFTVAQYQKKSLEKIEGIIARGKTPILTGGSGFYIDSVTGGIRYPEVPPNEILREKFAKKTKEELFTYLQKIDPIRAKIIDKHNKVRLIRAIEIVHSLGRVPKIKNRTPKYNFIKIGLDASKKELEEKIEKRLLARIRKGMIAEAKKLHKNGLSWQRMEELGLEYRYLAYFLQNKISKKEMIESLKLRINQFAKRQKTWMKRDKEIKWFKVSRKITKADIGKILDYIEKKF